MAASERASGGENSFIPVRVRWFDDVAPAAIAVGVPAGGRWLAA
jgi:hypothetical protein